MKFALLWHDTRESPGVKGVGRERRNIRYQEATLEAFKALMPLTRSCTQQNVAHLNAAYKLRKLKGFVSPSTLVPLSGFL